MDAQTANGHCIVPAPARFTPFPRAALDGSIGERFAAIAARHAGDLAVLAPDGTLTYAELDARSRAVAEAVGGDPEPVVVLCEQRPVLVTAVLGALRSGSAYVPLDPTFPVARLARTIERCGARTIVAAGEALALAHTLAAGGLRVVDADRPAAAGAAPTRSAGPDDLAYVYFTSGSTGEPKGVEDTHRNVLHNVLRYTDTLGLCPGDRLTLLQRPAFSGAVSSMFGALLNGATCCPFDLGRDGTGALRRWLGEQGITVYHSVPGIFRAVAAGGGAYARMRVVRLEGDRATRADLEAFSGAFGPGCVLVNGLGATECGLVRQFPFRPGDPLPDGAPIGYPVVDMEVAVVRDDGSAAAAGEAGEIVVRSSYLSPGYRDDPERTAERFSTLADGRRAYRTGDRGRLAADGCLELLGRVDHQPRFRGQPVETDAIERALVRASLAERVAVAVREQAGRERLVAYVVPGRHGAAPQAELRAAVAAEVPPGSVPTDFVTLPELPTGANGKVDLDRLPAEIPSRARSVPPAAPRHPLEEILASAWSDVLGVGEVGVHDAFADLGGDSLSAAEMLTEVERRLGTTIPQTVLLQTETVEELAVAIGRAADGDGPDGVTVLVDGPGTPIAFATGDLVGAGLYVRHLAERLGGAHPVVAIAPFDAGREPVPETIEEMARRRTAQLERARPSDSWVVAGYCGPGGLLAYETARQLEARGAEVRKIVLLDTFPLEPHLTGTHRAGLARVAAEVVSHGLRAVPSLRRRVVRHRALRALAARGGETAWDGWPGTSPQSLVAFDRARAQYEPGPVAAPVHVLWPADEPLHPGREEFRAGWARIAGHAVSLADVPGDHVTAVTREIDALAAAILAALDGL